MISHAIKYFNPLIGKSLEFCKAINLAMRTANSDASILLQGETGTGKELFVEAIHKGSKRRTTGHLVPINCAAITETLFESEIMGHEKGAFTGATEKRQGKVEYADQGTLFLDEISEMPLPMQTKFLRVLQQKQFSPVGSNKTFESNFRIICTTNIDLKTCITNGRFRNDLYHRINVIRIVIPPLRYRRDDILILANHFIKKICHQQKINVKKIDEKTETYLTNYLWPGNVRELENVCKRAVTLTDSNDICYDVLPQELTDPKCRFDLNDIQILSKAIVSNKFPIDIIKTATIRTAYEQCGCRLKDTVKFLENMGFSESTIKRRLK